MDGDEEEIYTLFEIKATDGLRAETLAVYARDEHHAREEKARKWIAHHQRHLPIVTVTGHPNGLTINLLTVYPHMGVIVLPGQFVASIAEKMRDVSMRDL